MGPENYFKGNPLSLYETNVFLTQFQSDFFDAHAIGTVNSNEYKEAKKELLHAVTISATFNINRNLQDIKKLNNLIVIDVDAKDNPDFTVEQLKNITANFPFVAITMKSASNKGIFNIIPYKEGLNYAGSKN